METELDPYVQLAKPLASEVNTRFKPAPVDILTVLLKVAAPVAVKEVKVDEPDAVKEVKVVAPVTPNVPPIVSLFVTLKLVNVEVPALTPPVKVNEVPVAAPITGVTKVGVLANTKAPVPVSSVTALIKFALVGVAKNDAIPVPKPLTPVAIGKPVALVKVALDGVPKFGVVKIGLVNVLFVNVSVPASVASVPVEPGSVMIVVPAIAGATTLAVPEVEPL